MDPSVPSERLEPVTRMLLLSEEDEERGYNQEEPIASTGSGYSEHTSGLQQCGYRVLRQWRGCCMSYEEPLAD